MKPKPTLMALMSSLLWLAAPRAQAAEVHGTISENGKPLAKGFPVKLDCSGQTASAATDSFGSYSLKATASGDCKLTVEYKGTGLTLPVTVYEKPSRYDLIVKTEGGKSSLVRK